MIEYRALGALQVVVDGATADIGGARQRRLLTALLVHRNTVVATTHLVDAVFAGEPTPRAEATLRSYMTRLRRTIGAAGGQALQRQGSGYRLAVADEAFDAARFEQLAERGRRELAYGDGAAAAATLHRAVQLWQGRAYQELAAEPWVQPEARRLEELWHVAHERLIDAELDCGRAREVVGDLERLIDAEPFRDAYRSRLMLALYRSGRAADALAGYRDYRTLLAEELGLDPGPELAALEQRILAHDPALTLNVPAGRPLRGYLLGERLGRGRRGTVYAARLPDVPRDYAIRLYAAEIADDPLFVRAFEADARRLASLEHPALVAVHDAWREPGAGALVMRRMTGGTLRDLLERGPLSRAQAAGIFERVGGALVAVTRRGLVHGNLRAGSVLFDADGGAHLGGVRVGEAGDAADDAAAFVALVRGAGIRDVPEPVSGGDGRRAVEATVDAVLSHLRADPAVALAGGNPYVGLRAFDEADADRFFGREALVADLIGRLQGADPARFVLVVGGSGSGKSSAVRAGLVPRLRHATDGGWTVAVMLPGTAPFKELAEALRRVSVGDTDVSAGALRDDPTALATIADGIAPHGGRVLLVIDQLDELFSLGAADDRDPFLAMVARGVTEPRGRLSVVATLRADWFDRPLEHPRFASVVHGATVTVPGMTAAELETAITGPAGALAIEPGLAGELVASVVDQPAALPALQFTLFELAERGGDRLARADLAILGGIDGAIATRAEQLFRQLSDERRQVVRRLFERLVVIGPTGGPARRRATRGELIEIGRSDVIDQVVETWVQARLLTSDRHPETREPTVEVAHEAVLARWPRLLGWIETDREWLRALAQLEQAAATWDELDHDPGALLRGARLDRALEVTDRRGPQVPPAIRDLLDASVVLRDAEAAQQAEAAARQVRTNRRLRRQRILLSAALVLAVLVGALAVERQVAASRSAAEASRNAAAADARAQAATTGLIAASDEALDADWSLALLLATEARRIDDSPATRRGLLNAIVSPRPIPTTVHTDPTGFQAVDVDEEQGLIVGKDPLGPIHVIDRVTGEAVGDPLPAPALFRAGGLDVHDGKIAAGGSTSGGVLAVVYDALSGERVAAVRGRADEAAEVAFNADGSRLAVTGAGRVRIFDTGDWSLTALLTTGDDGPDQLISAAWSADGRSVYAGSFSGRMYAWDVPRRRGGAPTPPARSAAVAVRPEPTPIGSITPIPDSPLLAVGALDPSVYLVDAESLRIVEGPLGHDNSVFGVAAHPSGDRIAVATVNRVVIWSLQVRRLPNGDVRLDLTPSRDADLQTDATDVAFDSQGRMITAGFGGEITSWDLDPPAPAFEPVPDAGPGIPTFSPHGGVLAMWGGGEGVRLHDAESYELVGRLDIARPDRASIASVAFPDRGRVTVVWCPDTDPRASVPCPGRLAVFDRRSGDAVAGPVDLEPVADWAPGLLAVSPDGSRVALGRVGGVVEVRDGDTLELLHELNDLVRDDESFVIDTSFSPERPGLLAATTADDAAVWDVSDDEPELVVKGRTGLLTHFTPDGDLVTSDQDGTLELRDPDTFEVVDSVQGLPGPVLAPSFTRDGSLMVTSDDVTANARLWRLDRLEVFGGPIDGVGGTVRPDGSAVVFGGDPVRSLTLDPEAWERAACETAGRNLTREEWERYFVDESYRRTCP